MLGLGVAGDRGGPTGTATASPKDIYFCTITGTDRADHLRGTSGPDVICGGAGDDLIRGLGGGDWVWAGSGADRIFGGPGQDALRGGDGADSVNGLVGMDRVQGGRGPDKLTGGPGADVLRGEPQSDRLFGGYGADTLDGGLGSDYIYDPHGDNHCVEYMWGDHLLYEHCSSGPNATTTELVEFSVTPQTVDTSAGPVEISFHIRLRDSKGGLTDMSGVFVRHFRLGTEYAVPAFRTSGDGWDSVYDTKFVLPQYSPQGHWSFLAPSAGPEQLAALGFPTGIDQVGPGDENPPQLDQVTITPLQVNTATGDQTITFRAHATDDFGIPDVADGNNRYNAVDANLSFPAVRDDPGGPHFQVSMLRVSGDARDGFYEGQITLPAGSRIGRWQAGVGARDIAGNGAWLGGDDVEVTGG